MVQNITKSKSITQIVTPTEQMIRRDMVIEILMTGITKIEVHTTQKGINLMIDITIEIKVVIIGHQKQIPMRGIPMVQIGIMTDIGTEIDIMEGIFMIEGDTLLITLMMKQVNSRYKRELRHVPTEQCFQPQHSINHPGYPVYHTNYQYAEPTLSVFHRIQISLRMLLVINK